MARPTLYDPAYCGQIVEHMRDGASVLSFAAEIGVARDTISEWANVHPEFSVALSKGKAACAAWWEKTARSVASSGQGNAPMCIFGLKNMGQGEWQDKSQVEHGVTGDLAERLLRSQGRIGG